MTPEPLDLDALCRLLHDAYEDAAERHGWRTQRATRQPWDRLPEANKRTMRCAVRALVEHLAEQLGDEQSAAWLLQAVARSA